MIISKYNSIVRYKNKVRESFALIDVQLKLRFDLIPNLVSVVKKYAEHEKETLTEIAKLRNLAVNSTDKKERLDYDQILYSRSRGARSLPGVGA
jgi:LemA protein